MQAGWIESSFQAQIEGGDFSPMPHHPRVRKKRLLAFLGSLRQNSHGAA